MCGIVGFTGPKNIPKLQKLLKLVEHRGRDGEVTFYSSQIHLGMNRLAIIGINSNPYPIRYKHFVLVFNGEIYNHVALRAQLRKKGVRFTTACDAEVILPLYDQYGVSCFSKLDGMFALAIFDTLNKKLFIARDKSGEKPLYYASLPSGFIFASELKVILSSCSRLALNQDSLIEYFVDGFAHSPKTLVKNIYKLGPSEYLEFDPQSRQLRADTYWRPPSSFSFVSSSELKLIDQLDRLLQQAVESRLISDVSLGCFLSGGVDSSLVTALTVRKKRGMHTFSISFPQAGNIDESKHAQSISTYLGTNHTQINCTALSTREVIENIGLTIDEPIVDPAYIPTYLMSLVARKSVKVVLTGEGADELFAGYTRYQKQITSLLFSKQNYLFSLLRSIMSVMPSYRMQSLSQKLSQRYSPQHVWNPKQLSRLLRFPIMRSTLPMLLLHEDNNPLLGMQMVDYRGYLPDQLCMKVDKATMLANLEARAPYLDSKVVAFALNLSNSYKLKFPHGKYLLKKVAERYLPSQYVWRRKHGFDLPLRDWFIAELRDIVEESYKELVKHNRSNHLYYRQIIDDHLAKRKDHANKIWSVIVLMRWLKVHNILW